MENLSAIIKKHCVEQHITMVELASRMDMTPQGLYYRLRQNDVPLSWIEEFSDVFGCNLMLDLVHLGNKPVRDLQSVLAENLLLKKKVRMLEKECGLLKKRQGSLNKEAKVHRS
jgi:hypothetical protein